MLLVAHKWQTSLLNVHLDVSHKSKSLLVTNAIGNALLAINHNYFIIFLFHEEKHTEVNLHYTYKFVLQQKNNP